MYGQTDRHNLCTSCTCGACLGSPHVTMLSPVGNYYTIVWGTAIYVTKKIHNKKVNKYYSLYYPTSLPSLLYASQQHLHNIASNPWHNFQWCIRRIQNCRLQPDNYRHSKANNIVIYVIYLYYHWPEENKDFYSLEVEAEEHH